MVLSNHAWRAQFGADPSVVGRHLVEPFSHRAVSIIGVAPPGLDYPIGAAAWRTMDSAQKVGAVILGVGRLAPGATLNAARAEFFSIVNRLEPASRLTGARAETFMTAVVGDVRPILVVLAAAVALLLLIACVNVGTLVSRSCCSPGARARSPACPRRHVLGYCAAARRRERRTRSPRGAWAA